MTQEPTLCVTCGAVATHVVRGFEDGEKVVAGVCDAHRREVAAAFLRDGAVL